MKKNKKSELNPRHHDKGIADRSKTIGKNKKTHKKAVKKKANGVEYLKHVPNKSDISKAPSVSSAVGKLPKNHKQDKQKSVTTPKKAEHDKVGEQDLVKIEKKKTKKLAQKLKKKNKHQKAEPKSDNPKQISENSEITEKGNNEEKSAIKPAKGNSQKNLVATGIANKKKKNKILKNKQEKGRKIDKEHEKEVTPRDPAQEAATVFVGNLPVNTKRVQLAKIFQPYGTVNAIRLRTAAGKTIFKHKQRKEAGSLNAYVILQDAESAKRALSLSGVEFKGSHLRVTAVDSKQGEDGSAKRTIFVGNLKYTATEKNLHEIFSSCGEIEYIRCLQESDKGCKGVAYVCFKNADAVGLALELEGTMLDERPLHVERYSVKKLGAKEARETANVANKTPKKKSQKGSVGKKTTTAKNQQNNKKKNEFHGVKVETGSGGIAKKKKKKSNSEMKKLAKKIAPKS